MALPLLWACSAFLQALGSGEGPDFNGRGTAVGDERLPWTFSPLVQFLSTLSLSLPTPYIYYSFLHPGHTPTACSFWSRYRFPTKPFGQLHSRDERKRWFLMPPSHSGSWDPTDNFLCTLQVLGDFIGSMPELRRILNGLKDQGFKEGDYDVVRNNCNHFCDEFAFALVGKRIPPWVNRAASIGTWAGLGEVRINKGRVCVCVSARVSALIAQRGGPSACELNRNPYERQDRGI